MSGRNAKRTLPSGRTAGQRDLPHVRMYDWMLKSAAYRSLSVYSRCLYVEMKRRYNGSNNGGISMAFREAMELVGCSNGPMKAAFAELQEKGFIRVVQRGAFDWKAHAEGKGRATTWELTEYKADMPVPSLAASKDFMRWSPMAAKEKNAVVGDTTIGVTRYHHA